LRPELRDLLAAGASWQPSMASLWLLAPYLLFRLAGKIVEEIHRIQTKPWVIMEVCGGQTHAIVRFGIDELAA
jgi:hydrogenase expression/formation protein HypD